VLFLLTIVLSVLLQYTDSDCPFGIFKLFLWTLYFDTATYKYRYCPNQIFILRANANNLTQETRNWMVLQPNHSFSRSLLHHELFQSIHMPQNSPLTAAETIIGPV